MGKRPGSEKDRRLDCLEHGSYSGKFVARGIPVSYDVQTGDGAFKVHFSPVSGRGGSFDLAPLDDYKDLLVREVENMISSRVHGPEEPVVNGCASPFLKKLFSGN